MSEAWLEERNSDGDIVGWVLLHSGRKLDCLDVVNRCVLNPNDRVFMVEEWLGDVETWMKRGDMWVKVAS